MPDRISGSSSFPTTDSRVNLRLNLLISLDFFFLFSFFQRPRFRILSPIVPYRIEKKGMITCFVSKSVLFSINQLIFSCREIDFKMLSFIHNINATIKNLLGPVIIDGRLNQVRFAFAIQCYWIQSRIFRIPDRFAFISSGPPRLQIAESGVLLLLMVLISHMIFYGAVAVYLLFLMGNRPVRSFAAFLCLIIIAVVGIVWIS